QPIQRNIVRILKELGVYVLHSPGKDLSASSIPERWLGKLRQQQPLTLGEVVNFFLIYRNRLYSFSSDSPFSFSDQKRLIRRLMARGDRLYISFEQVYRAELYLREEIMFALLRRFSTRNRLDYLVGKEMVMRSSEQFITALHTEVERYFKRIVYRHRRQHSRLLAEKESLTAEVRNVERLQKKSVQQDLPRDDERIEFYHYFQPLISVGGDFFRVLRINNDEYTILLADIAGHGLGAAMYMNTVRNSFDSFEKYLDRPERLLHKMDRDLYGKLDDNFVTAICAHINLKKRRLTYCNAGHPKAFLVQRERKRVRFLRQNSKILGIFHGTEFRQDRIELTGQDRLIMYTDGITETFNEDGQMLGERGLLNLLRGTINMNLNDSIEYARKELAAYQGNARTEDDRTLIVTDIHIPG
ncbi:MAG: serine/threonine-protein phosphatase, partial [Leptospiraceae bacterium]|nr:serine/threonine-protein phosphatase [Leptospiraceae bacterium]